MNTHRLIGRAGRILVETLLLPVILVLSIETWWRVSSPDKSDNGKPCRCGCGWEE